MINPICHAVCLTRSFHAWNKPNENFPQMKNNLKCSQMFYVISKEYVGSKIKMKILTSSGK